MKIAMLQINPGQNKAENLKTIENMARSAAEGGAILIVIPEFFASMGSDQDRLASADRLGSGSFAFLSQLARDLKVYVIGGSAGELPAQSADATSQKLFNTHQSFAPDGQCINTYRKAHLFDLISISGEREFKESDWCIPGEPPSELFSIQSNNEIWNALTLICYDLRFPEIFRRASWALSPPDVVFLPAAFTHRTGSAHWKILVQARAIENQCFIVACNQTGYFGSGRRNYGHSMVVDPWGEIIAEMGEEVGVCISHLDRSRIKAVRNQIPALENRVIKT